MSSYSLIFFSSAVTSTSAFPSSASFSSDYCNKSGFFFPSESDCSIVVPVKLSCMSSMHFSFEKPSVSKGLIFSDQTNAQFYYYLSNRFFMKTHNMIFFVQYNFLDLPTQVYSSVSEISSRSYFDFPSVYLFLFHPPFLVILCLVSFSLGEENS